MDILFPIATGLGLRIICLNLTDPISTLAPVIIGLWEGALSYLVLSQDPEVGRLRALSSDHFLAYGFRLVFDLVLAQNPTRPLAVVLWTGITLWLCQFIDQQSIPQQSIRRRRSRRHRVAATSSLPSHVRVYKSPQPQSDPKSQPVPSNSPPHVELPPHEQPSTPPSFFLQGEELLLSPIPVLAPSSAMDSPHLPSALVAQSKVNEATAQNKPASLPTPPVTSTSLDVDKGLTTSARRLSTIIEASSMEDAPVAANASAQSTLPEKKEQDTSANGARTTTTRTDTVPLPVPDPFTRQSRPRVPVQASIAGGSESARLISVNPATVHKFLLRPYPPEEEGLSDELLTPLNPVSRALLDDDVENVFTDNEADELQTPLTFNKQLADRPLSPLSPLFSVQVRLNDAQQPSIGQVMESAASARVVAASDATLTRGSLLISSEADERDSLKSDADSSMLSTAVPNELYAHGGDWRKKAWEEEKNYSELKKQRDKALEESRARDALMLKVQMDNSDVKSKKLHEKAARRYYAARNTSEHAHQIDVHGLRVQEAVERTEKALRNALQAGYGTLKVITGRGLHSKGKLPVLKFALIRAMEQQKIPCEPDPINPGALIIRLPP